MEGRDSITSLTQSNRVTESDFAVPENINFNYSDDYMTNLHRFGDGKIKLKETPMSFG